MGPLRAMTKNRASSRSGGGSNSVRNSSETNKAAISRTSVSPCCAPRNDHGSNPRPLGGCTTSTLATLRSGAFLRRGLFVRARAPRSGLGSGGGLLLTVPAFDLFDAVAASTAEQQRRHACGSPSSYRPSRDAEVLCHGLLIDPSFPLPVGCARWNAQGRAHSGVSAHRVHVRLKAGRG